MIIKKLSIFFIALLLVGCKSEDPNPELRDPIYLDIKKMRESVVKDQEAEKKSLEETQKKLSGSEARTKERVIIQRDIQKAQKTSKSWISRSTI